MKKCPKCKAEIQEEARFCLYCMTSFEEKQTIKTPKENKRWLYIVAIVLVVMLVATGSIIFAPKDNPNVVSNDILSDSTSGNSTISIENSTSSDGETESSVSENSSAIPSEVTYVYRDAKYGDDFSTSANPENAVVITGVKTISPSGEYKIPDTIDGKTVVAIMGLAFCDEDISSTVEKVFVPSTIKTIWNYAFADCYNLTDIYFAGDSIYTESMAFPENSKRNGVLTIHCSANCSDRNFRYYKNSASNYDAEYVEWNG